MSVRDRLKGVQPKEMPETPWTCGDDVPITFEPQELKEMEFKTIKQNYRIGAISKAVYLLLMGMARNR